MNALPGVALLGHESAQAIEDHIACGARLEPLGVVDTEEAIGMAVVDQPLGNRSPHPGDGHITAEDRIDQGGLTRTGLAEHRQVEAAQGGKGLGQLGLEHALELGATEIVGAASGLDGHGSPYLAYSRICVSRVTVGVWHQASADEFCVRSWCWGLSSRSLPVACGGPWASPATRASWAP